MSSSTTSLRNSWVTQSSIQGGELEVLIAHSIPEAREGLSNVVLFGVPQQRDITTGMAAYPAPDSLTVALLQHRPCLISLFDERAAQDFYAVAIIERLFAPMPLQFMGTQICQGRQFHLADCFIYADNHRARPPSLSAKAEVSCAHFIVK